LKTIQISKLESQKIYIYIFIYISRFNCTIHISKLKIVKISKLEIVEFYESRYIATSTYYASIIYKQIGTTEDKQIVNCTNCQNSYKKEIIKSQYRIIHFRVSYWQTCGISRHSGVVHRSHHRWLRRRSGKWRRRGGKIGLRRRGVHGRSDDSSRPLVELPYPELDGCCDAPFNQRQGALHQFRLTPKLVLVR